MAERSGGTRVAEGEQTRKIERDEKVLRWRSVLERRSRISNLSPYTGSTTGINPRSLHAQTMETIHWNEKVGLHCRTRGRGVQGGDRLASVCLLTASLSLSISFLLTLFLYLPRSLLPSRLYLLPFVPVGYVRVPDSTLFSSLFFSPFSPSSIPYSMLSAPPFFSPPRRDGIPVSFSIGRLKERIVNRRMSRGFRNGDCSIQRSSPGVARARARASKPWMNSVLTGTQASAISRGGYLFLSQSAF